MDTSIFQHLTEQNNLVFWAIAPDAQTVYFVSPSYETVFGQPCTEFIANPSQLIHRLHTDDRDKVLHGLLWQRQGQSTFTEYRITHPDGQTRWLQTYTFPVLNAREELTQTIAITHDCTDRQRVIEQSTHPLNTAQDILASPDFCTALEALLWKVCMVADWPFGEVWIPNATETALVMSNVWYGGLNPDRDRLLFHEMSQDFAFQRGQGLPGRVWQSTRPEWQEDVSSLSRDVYLRADVAKRCNFKTALGIPLTVDGLVLAVIVLYRSEARPQDQALIELLSAMTHLSAVIQKQHNEAMFRQAETKYRRIFENAVEGIYQTSSEGGGRYLTANMTLARIYGYDSPEELLDSVENIAQQLYLDPAVREQLTHQLNAHGHVRDFEVQVRRRDGEVIWISESMQGVYNVKGELLYYEGSVKDITERKTARMRIEQLNATLEQRVQERTATLEKVNAELRDEIEERERTEKALRDSEQRLQAQAAQLKHTLQELRQTQYQLVQAEKMSSLGQLVAGIAHEVNNPVNFIKGNVLHLRDYTDDLIQVLQAYETAYPQTPTVQALKETVELDYTIADISNILNSMDVGTKRIQDIVRSLRTFVRLDEAEVKSVDLHDGLESTLNILRYRCRPSPSQNGIDVQRCYGQLPEVECCPGLVNQVFMNVLSNAIDALEGHDVAEPILKIITTQPKPGWVTIGIQDNGPGIAPNIRSRLFDPFFTTKPVGKGTGLGLSLSYKIVVEQHKGNFYCQSSPMGGAAFMIELPVVSRI